MIKEDGGEESNGAKDIFKDSKVITYLKKGELVATVSTKGKIGFCNKPRGLCRNGLIYFKYGQMTTKRWCQSFTTERSKSIMHLRIEGTLKCEELKAYKEFFISGDAHNCKFNNS